MKRKQSKRQAYHDLLAQAQNPEYIALVRKLFAPKLKRYLASSLEPSFPYNTLRLKCKNGKPVIPDAIYLKMD